MQWFSQENVDRSCTFTRIKPYYGQEFLSGYDWSLPYCFLPRGPFFAGDRYHHHIATNTWGGTKIVPSIANNFSKVCLDHFALQLVDNKKEEDSLKSQLTSNGMLIDEKLLESDLHQESSFYIYDPYGIKIQIIFL